MTPFRSTSDRVMQWRILLEEYGPYLVFIPGNQNTITDATSHLDYDSILNPDRHINYSLQKACDKTGIEEDSEEDSLRWQAVINSFSRYHHSGDNEKSQNLCPNNIINNEFASTGKEEEEISPLTISEISDAQRVDRSLKYVFKRKQKGEN